MGGVAAGALMALLLMFSPQVMEAASQAARVFISGVMPALLPMMVLCRVFAPTSGRERSGRGEYVGAVLFAFAAGSPASAQRIRSLWEAGAVRPAALPPLLAACGVMSPMFFTGTLAGWTGLRAGCRALLMCHWVGALIAAGLIGLWQKRRPYTPVSTVPPSAPADSGARRSPAAALTEAVSATAASLLAVCGAMMTFAVLAGLLRALLAALFPAWTQANAPLLAAVWALLEIGGGAAALLQSCAAPPMPLLCALCSFGGLSIWLQNLLFLQPCIRPAKLLCLRALHGAVSWGLALLIFDAIPGLMRPF